MKQRFSPSGVSRGNAHPSKGAASRLIDKGKHHMQRGRYEQALYFLKQALKIDPVNPELHYCLAQTYYFLGHYQQSRDFLQTMAALNSQRPNASRERLAAKDAAPSAIDRRRS